MALPKLDSPVYELEQPSTGEKIKYRPFLVKEQKTLMHMHHHARSLPARAHLSTCVARRAAMPQRCARAARAAMPP